MKNLFITIVLFLVLLLVLFHYNVKENYQVIALGSKSPQTSGFSSTPNEVGQTAQPATSAPSQSLSTSTSTPSQSSSTSTEPPTEPPTQPPTQPPTITNPSIIDIATKSTPLAPSLYLEINDNENPQINFVLGDDGGSVITSAYIISVKNNNPENVRLDKIPLEPDKNSYDIELINLERNNNYYFTGVCINSIGMGRLSRPVKSFY